MVGVTDKSKYKKLASILFVIALFYVAMGIWNILTTPILGVMFCPGYEICRVFPGSPAEDAGMLIGDKLLTVDGTSIREVGPLGLGAARPGDVRVYEIERLGELREVKVTLERPQPRSTYLRLRPTIVGLFFIISGFYIAVLRPARLSRTYFLFCLSVGWMLSNPPRATAAFARFFSGALEITAWFACAALLVYFFWIFPRPKRLIHNNPTLIGLLFGIAGFAGGALVLALASTLLLGFEVPHKLLVLLDYSTGVVIIGYFGLAASGFIHGYFTTPPGPVKRNLRLVLLAFCLGLLPVVAYSVVFAIDPQLELPLEGHVILFVLLIPMALGYSVFHHLSDRTTSAFETKEPIPRS